MASCPHRFLVSILVLFSGCSREQLDHPRTKDEFVAAYRAAYDAGDTKTIGRWVKWGDTPNQIRTRYPGMVSVFAGKYKVDSISVVPFDEHKHAESDGRRVHYSLEPVYWFHIETVGNDGFQGSVSRITLRGALGCEDGKLWFCGPIPDSEEPREGQER